MKPRRERILHIDGDAFFAACEMALDPTLRDKPVWVGGGRRGDGIVIAANYLAKRHGIHVGMACFEAKRACPDGVLVRPHYDEYRQLSLEMFRRVKKYTPTLVPISIDEGFLDFTDSPAVFRCRNAAELAEKIRAEIANEVGITVSAGLGSSCWLSKLATETAKPDGFREVSEREEIEFLRDVPVTKLVGIAKSRKAGLATLGIWTIGDAANAPLGLLRKKFGIFGEQLWLLARGELRETLTPSHKPRTTISSATTLPFDEPDYERALLFLLDQTERVVATFFRENLKAREMGAWIRFNNFESVSESVKFDAPQFDPVVVNRHLEAIFARLLRGQTLPIRQVGVSFWNFEPLNLQPDLFGEHEEFRRRELHHALETVEKQFGKNAVVTGTRMLLRHTAPHLVAEKPKCPFIPQREMEWKVEKADEILSDLPRTWGRSTSGFMKDLAATLSF